MITFLETLLRGVIRLAAIGVGVFAFFAVITLPNVLSKMGYEQASFVVGVVYVVTIVGAIVWSMGDDTP